MTTDDASASSASEAASHEVERASEKHEEPVEQWQGKWEGLFPKKHPLVVLNTGNGKGKTTAALGVTLRAWGRGWKICWLQFIKSKTSNYGETRAARRMGIEMIPLGDGFTWLSKDIEHDKALARECWALAKEKIESAEFDLVVLDEITYPITYGWLEVEDVIEVLTNRPKDVDVIMTGRDAHPRLVEFADTVTEMTEVKHAYQSGVKAQPGIDY
ncbi:MAG: cob(I)yrinic acid a,c-diamide adenosyltransferase [Dehalococcoidia bacterium]